MTNASLSSIYSDTGESTNRKKTYFEEEKKTTMPQLNQFICMCKLYAASSGDDCGKSDNLKKNICLSNLFFFLFYSFAIKREL